MDLRPLRPALGALRTRIRGLYLVHGLGRVAAVFAGLLLLSFLLDFLLQPPRGVRIVHGLLSLAALAWSVHRFLVRPMRRSLVDLTDEELALAVEARVPSLQDRLAGALPWGPRASGRGRVVHVDHYGNLITDLPAAEGGEAVSIDGNTLRIVKTYSDVPPNTLLAYVGSMGTIEIAVRDGRADTRLAAPRGTPVVPVPTAGPYR